ncbi:MAG: glycosyltransferase family A protein [Tepidisphaeraceae bacterium]|jgi:glycosyltransferase involved in cell wall biosynthesis
MENSNSPRATVVITTRNRGSDLRVALTSALKQDEPIDILVIDDGSSDGTSEMVAREFPSVRVERSEKSLGLVVQRNRAAQMVRTPFIVSIDDDAEFTSPRVVRQTLEKFSHPVIGAVGIPFIDIKLNDKVQQKAPDEQGVHIAHWYIGTAHAVRTEVFRAVGGYRGFFYSQYEELDVGMRLFDAGYIIRLGSSDPIHHYLSPKRQLGRNVTYSLRNLLLIGFLNVPFPQMLTHQARACYQGLKKHGASRLLGSVLLGMVRGFWGHIRYFPQRRPMTGENYRLYNRLSKSIGGMRYDDLFGRPL